MRDASQLKMITHIKSEMELHDELIASGGTIQNNKRTPLFL